MLRQFRFWLCALALAEVTGRVLKVLPYFLDEKGRHSGHASLFEHGSYQAWLRAHPERRSGLRFDVQWKARDAKAANLKLRLELRSVGPGDAPQNRTLGQPVKSKGMLWNWAAMVPTGEEYKRFDGTPDGWAKSWRGDRVPGKQESFLWRTLGPESAIALVAPASRARDAGWRVPEPRSSL